MISSDNIRADLPAASPLLAYGETRQIVPAIAWWALLCLGITLILSSGVFLALWRIDVPEHLVAIAILRGDTKLPDAFPRVWRNTLQGSRWPVFFGLTRESERITPFAFACRPFSCRPTRLKPPVRPTPTKPTARLISWWSRLVFNRAYLQLDTQALTSDPTVSNIISGPIDDQGQWKTDFRLPTGDLSQLPVGTIAINLDTLPEAWPRLSAALQLRGFKLDLQDTPTAFGWTFSSSTHPNLELVFAHGYTSSTVLSFAAAAGLVETAAYHLPDATVVEELRLPMQTLASHPASIKIREFKLADGERLEVKKNRLVLYDEVRARPVKHAMHDSCQSGRPIARFISPAIERLAELLGFPTSTPWNTLQINEVGGRMWVCLQ